MPIYFGQAPSGARLFFAFGSYVMFVCPLVMFITFSVIAAEYTVSDSPMTTRKYVDLMRQITYETGENHE